MDDPNDQQIEEALAEVQSRPRKKKKSPVIPYRIQLNYLGAHMDPDMIESMVENLVDYGEEMGLIFSYGGMQEMPLEDIVPDSTLDQIVSGRPPRIK